MRTQYFLLQVLRYGMLGAAQEMSSIIASVPTRF